ncbi:hypothetical protein CHELA40_13027 [Chelatococcus asaccharovorans]|nr:hypothetical protein CHELA40_13027 [Chelatococcus asaccharovorans]CAH1680769.1 hypothetical protein CHELA17_62593 [Chelatococcus asaccharovorans]
MVLLRHLHPPDTTLGANVGVKKTTSKLLVLVELLNLTFDLELDVRRDSNVKFAPLARDRKGKLCFCHRGAFALKRSQCPNSPVESLYGIQ